jgi:PIN domain nuclease of toxin-antitoxin system
LVDLWYVTQTTKKVSTDALAGLRDLLVSSPAFTLRPIDVAVVNATISIPRELLTDPWDRFIVGTARVLAVPLVTRDQDIRDSGLVSIIW